MRTTVCVLLAACAAISTPAAAATFAGPRAELRGGWDRTTIDLKYNDGVDVIDGSGHKSGFDFGGEVGYDARLSPTMIAGAYAGLEFASTKECSGVFGDDEACLKLGRNLTVGARLGAIVAPKVMFYVKGGYSNGQLKASYTSLDDPSSDFSDHANRGGYHLGVGGEFAVGSRGYIRAEYVRTNYDAYRYSDSFADVTIDGHRDQLLLGAGLRF